MKPRRRWFAYSLRTLFAVLTVFGVWLGYQLKWIRDRHEVSQWHYRTIDGCKVFHVERIGEAAAPWSIRMLGEPGYKQLTVIAEPQSYKEMDDKIAIPLNQNRDTVALLQRVRKLFPEADCRDHGLPY